MPEPIAGPRTKGCDLSHRDGYVDYHMLSEKGDLSFVYLKATEGSHTVDPRYTENRRRATEARWKVGSYHYFTPTWDAVAQAQHFLAATPTGLHGQLPPALDLELDNDKRAGVSPQDYLKSAIAFVRHLENRLHAPIVLYTYRDMWEWLGSPHGTPLHDCLLWIADYNEGEPMLPYGFTSWTFRQTTDQGKIAGWTGLDLDEFNGSPEELSTLLIP